MELISRKKLGRHSLDKYMLFNSLLLDNLSGSNRLVIPIRLFHDHSSDRLLNFSGDLFNNFSRALDTISYMFSCTKLVGGWIRYPFFGATNPS
ncbi:hypothetical protein PC116_g13764 [Phytophthora cactorum]|nr:hypothetical protein PC116_g13764 [Phytophthora cactorum]